MSQLQSIPDSNAILACIRHHHTSLSPLLILMRQKCNKKTRPDAAGGCSSSLFARLGVGMNRGTRVVHLIDLARLPPPPSMVVVPPWAPRLVVVSSC